MFTALETDSKKALKIIQKEIDTRANKIQLHDKLQ